MIRPKCWIKESHAREALDDLFDNILVTACRVRLERICLGEVAVGRHSSTSTIGGIGTRFILGDGPTCS